jgi:NitT/TauT family transport system substrate-binding protein
MQSAAVVGAATALPAKRLFAQEPRAKLRLGIVPLISSGPVFVALAKGYFEKVNLDVDIKYFADGALAMPSLIAGEIDCTASTLNAGMFNAVSKGAPYKLILDRGVEKPGFGSMTIAASNSMVAAGMTAVNKMGLLKGKRIAIQAPGSIDQYLLGLGAQRAGLDPRTDLTWNSGLSYPDIVKAIGANQADVANVPVPLGFLVERNNFGKLVFSGSDIEPNCQLACWVMSGSYLAANKSAAVRFAMAHTYAGRVFTKAAVDKDPAIIKIVSEATKVPPALIEAAAPRWTWFTENGMPNIQSCMAQGKFWTDTMKMISGAPVTEQQLFDLSPAIEGNERLNKSNPFA